MACFSSFLMLNRDIKYVWRFSMMFCLTRSATIIYANSYANLSVGVTETWQADSSHFWDSFSLDSALWIKLFLLINNLTQIQDSESLPAMVWYCIAFYIWSSLLLFQKNFVLSLYTCCFWNRSSALVNWYQ